MKYISSFPVLGLGYACLSPAAVCADARGSGNGAVYAVTYSANGCGASSSAVNIKGYMTNVTYNVMGSTARETCAENVMCRVDPESCPSPGGDPPAADENNSTGSGTGTEMISMLIDPNVATGIQNSYKDYDSIGPATCLPSTWYAGDCYFNYQRLDDLKSDPMVLANDQPDDLKTMKDYIYFLYYEDDTCTDLASILASASQQTIQVPSVSDPSLSCEMQSICSLDPTSDECQAIHDGIIVANSLSETRINKATGEVDVYECDPTNEAVGQDVCNIIHPQDCTKSSVLSNCHFRAISGPELARNPLYLVGDVGEQMSTDKDGMETGDGEGSGEASGTDYSGVGSVVVGLIIGGISLLSW